MISGRCVIGALLVFRATGLQAQSQAFAMDLADTSIVSVAADDRHSLRISPGTRGKLLLRTVGEAAERTIAELPAAPVGIAWSTDGLRFAIGIPDSAGDLVATRVIRLADGQHHTLAATGTPMGWTKAGELLMTRPGIAGHSHYLAIVSPSGEATTVYEFGGTAAIAPDGAHFYAIERGRLVQVERGTGLRRTVTATAANEDMPMLSPDGRSIAFASDKDGGWAIYVASLATLPIRSAIRLTTTDGAPTRYAGWWTDDGTLVLRTKNYAHELYRIDVDPSTGRAQRGIHRLTKDAADDEYPPVSPDGKRIAFSMATPNTQHIGIIDATGGTVRIIPANFTRWLGLRGWLSPDELLFEDTYSENRGLRTINILTGAVSSRATPIVGRSQWFVASRGELWFAPIGNPRTGAVVRALSVASGQTRDVATIDFIRQFSVSADAKLMAYATARPGTPSELHIRNLETGVDRIVRKEAAPGGVPWPMSFSPDGKYFFYFAIDDSITMVNVESGESWPLLTEAGAPQWGYNDAKWSSDGRYIVSVGYNTLVDSVQRRWRGLTSARVASEVKRAPRY